MRAARIKRAQTLVEAAQNSVGLEAGEAARLEIWVLVNDYILKAEQLKRLDEYLEEKVKEILGTKVQISHKKNNSGKIEIEYYSNEELERIIELLESVQNH